MENLINILDSFNPGWREKEYVDKLATTLSESVIPAYPALEVKIRHNRAVFPEVWDPIFSALKEAQIFKLFVPPEYGGNESSEEDLYYIMELLGYASPGLGVMFVAQGRAIDVLLHGDEALKETYLPRMADGSMGAIALTEEQAGSDPSAVGLMAKKEDDHYRFDGQKVFISNGGLADLYAVLANTKGIKGSRRSLSIFIVESNTRGFTIRDMPEKEGLKILPTGWLSFDTCAVPAKNLVGDEGRGLLIALDVIDRGRIHIAGICCGLAYRILSELYRHAHQRRQFDHPLTSSQNVSFQLADMHSQMNAARGLCFHALRQFGTPDYRISSSQAKLFASQMVMDLAARAQVLMGGRGYLRNDLINQLSADARGMEYLEGTSNIQKMIIARELFRVYQKERKSGEN